MKESEREADMPLLPAAVYKCFDCGVERNGEAKTASWVGSCRECAIGMMLVYTLNGEPRNRGFFPSHDVGGEG